jgi:hypothetical protein
VTQLVVICAYLAAWLVILRPPRGMSTLPSESGGWWRDVRFWASVVVVVQVAVYAVFG